MHRIAIIPARGGSKRVKGKNILEINGVPLIAHTILQARDWGKFDSIFVNSDDASILECAEKYGATPYPRPASLATDTAKVIDVVKEQMRTMGLADDTAVCIMLPTCPLRTSEDIAQAYNLFESAQFKQPIVSMTEYEKAPEQAFFINAKGVLERKFPQNYSSRSQDHGSAYRYNTAIIFTSPKIFLEQADIVGEEAIPYIMPHERSIDIDYDYQVQLVKLLLAARETQENSHA